MTNRRRTMELIKEENGRSNFQEDKEKALSGPSPKYIIPPGLIIKRVEFEAHYHIAKGKPIIIVGATGVGKTLFLHLFEKLYRREHGKNVPIVRINCSHFDDLLVRTELFGHAKGAFTGAVGRKEGLIKKADGGVLFMEEIGELPKDAQAKLLTVIEDGFFYRVGGTEPEKVSVQIVGTTNNIKNMRDDFWQRFMPFYISPLHERRGDVLYYLYDKFPDLIKTLTPQEVLWLLTYNWPGNVRELERVARLLERPRKMASELASENTALSNMAAQLSKIKGGDRVLKEAMATLKFLQNPKGAGSGKESEEAADGDQYRFLIAEEHEGFFSYVQSRARLRVELHKSGVDVPFLDEVPNRFRVGLLENPDPAFPLLSQKDGEFSASQITHRDDL